MESAIKSYKNADVDWSTQGMLRLSPKAMKTLFAPTLKNILDAVADVLNNDSVQGSKFINYFISC